MAAESEIVACERARYEAMRQHDVTRLDGLLDERLIYTHSNAAADDKQAYLRQVADGTFVYHAIEIAEECVTMFGEAALVRMRMSADVTVSGVRKAIDNRGLAVWIRAAGAWRLAAYQPTPIVGA